MVDRLDGRSDIAVSSRVTEPGWTIEELDDGFDAALASKPDVLVYSAGANDLETRGIGGMIDLLEDRVGEAKAATCVVYIVPAIDTASMEESEGAEVDRLLTAFGEVVAGWGVSVVAYPEIAAAMTADGERFFGEGGLGSFHPGTAAYDRIAESIAKEIASCT